MKKNMLFLLLCSSFCICTKSQTSPFFNNTPIEGPDAPIVQLNLQGNSIEINLSTSPISNNFNESYHALDTSIHNGYGFFDFQGYIIYQVIDSTNNHITNFFDTTKMKVVAQTDIIDTITSLSNHYYDTINGYCDSALMVNAANQGISHSFFINQDAFSGNPFQPGNTYCYIALAYAANTNKTNQICNNLPWSFLIGHKNSNGTGISPYCIEFNPTGIIKNDTQEDIKLYPNPAHNEITISCKDYIQQVQVEILNIQGQTLIKKSLFNTKKIDLNIESLVNGVYIIKIITDKEQKTIKFIKE